MVAASRDEKMQAATSVSDFNEIIRFRCAALRMTMIGRPRLRNGLSGLNGLRPAVGTAFSRSISGCSQFVVKSRKMWCEMRELWMGHTKRISHSEF